MVGDTVMTPIEWDLIKTRLLELSTSQSQVADALKELHECVDDSKDQIRDLKNSVDSMRQMILSMVPNGDIFQHRFDHAEIADTRGLKKVGRVKAVEVAVGGVVALLIAALLFYVKFGIRHADAALFRNLASSDVVVDLVRHGAKVTEVPLKQ